MLIEKTMDTGDILDIAKIEIDEDTDIESLHDKLSEISGPLIVNTILDYDNLYKNRTKQDEAKATYSKKIDKSMGHIDFNEKASDIKAKIMAFSNWPGTFSYYKNNKIKIHKITIIEKYTDNKIGQIIDANKDGIFVNCSDACIRIEEIQFEGKKRMDVKSFLLGNDIEKGEYLS